jgi:hypothetical protein
MKEGLKELKVMNEFFESLGKLEDRIQNYGPFPPTRRNIVLFTTGCDHEDHTPALSTSSDTLFAQAFCSAATVRTGIRYRAHAPYTSATSGDCAANWISGYLPEPEYFEKSIAFFKMILDAMNPRPEGVIIHVPSHGERIMSESFGEVAGLLGVRGARFLGDIVGDGFNRLTKEDYKDSPMRDLIEEGIEKDQFQHCGFFDYCIAEALGHLDRRKLDAMRRDMEQDLETALKKYPAAQLAGYTMYGGEVTKPLAIRLGVDPVNPYIHLDPKFQNSCPIVGRAIVNYTIDVIAENILDFERELYGDNP